MAVQKLDIRDGGYTPPAEPSALHRFVYHFIQDKRDVPFIALSAQITLVVLPLAALLFAFHHLFDTWVGWALGVGYLLVVFLGFVDRFILMLHCTSHRPLFKKPWRLLSHYIPWVIGPFMGETPETYYAHHITMHHPENNLETDLSTTMPYQRDSMVDWLRYWARFFFLAVFDLSAYFAKRKRYERIRKFLAGELSFYALCVALSFYDWRPTFVVFVFPFFLVRVLMMCGNWGQHAFVDAYAPGNAYRNSITCINTRYNKRAFNDGYHIVHHFKPAMHWTEEPGELRDNWEKYRDEKAIIFDGIDFFQVWMLLMLKRYDTLAAHFVDLDDKKRTDEEIIALLKERVKVIHREKNSEGVLVPVAA